MPIVTFIRFLFTVNGLLLPKGWKSNKCLSALIVLIGILPTEYSLIHGKLRSTAERFFYAGYTHRAFLWYDLSCFLRGEATLKAFPKLLSSIFYSVVYSKGRASSEGFSLFITIMGFSSMWVLMGISKEIPPTLSKKVSCNVKFETISMNFSYSVTLKTKGLSSFTHT